MQKYDVIIVGGGVAGLTTAIYALRGNLSVLMFEANMIGGQMSQGWDIENYPGFEKISGVDLALKMQAQAENLGLQIIYERVENIDLQNKQILASNGEYKADCIVLCNGVSPKRLMIDGEREYLGRGVSYCGVCDGALYKGKNVVVVGRGNSTIEEVLNLVGLAGHLTLINKDDRIKCDGTLLKKYNQIKDKITVFEYAKVNKVIGDTKVTGLEITAQEKTFCIPCDGLFVSIGRVPDTELLDGQIEMDERGYIISDVDMQTSVEGVFVAGDVRAKQVKQVATAVGDGCIAGVNAIKYVNSLK